jgi:hypothetical protein
MTTLAQVLARFNRTEPDLLVRDALGHWDTPLPLSEDFRKRVAKTAGLNNGVPKRAWWAAEYPFNCLAGALYLYVEDAVVVDATESDNLFPELSRQDLRSILEPGREDVDLIIAFDDVLILLEAKAFTSYSTRQMKSKLARLHLLHAFYSKLPHAGQRPVNFHLLITSPRPPGRLQVEWPQWACKGDRPPWMELKLSPSQDVLRVTRCNEQGISMKTGDRWRVTSKPR